MTSNRSKSPSHPENDNSMGRNQMAFLMQFQGAISKIKSPQPDTEELDLKKASGPPHKDTHKLHKENQFTPRPNEEVIMHKDRPVHNADGTNESIKRGNREPKSASQKDRPPAEHRHHGTRHNELEGSFVDRDPKATHQKIRPHTDRKHHGDKQDGTTVQPNDYEEELKSTRHKSRHADRKHHGDKHDDSTSQRNNEFSQTNDSKEKKKNNQKFDQQTEEDKYEGLPLLQYDYDKNSAVGSKSHKSTGKKERENTEQKQKRDVGNTGPEFGKVFGKRNDISLVFPDAHGNRSVMRIVVRSFATPKKSQNCVDVKIEGEKFNAFNLDNEEIENLIRELTKYVIQIQRALEEDDDLAPVSKSLKEPHTSLEVIELFKRTDKHSGKPVKEIKVTPSKSRQELGLSMKFIPSGVDGPEHEKTPSQETDKKRDTRSTMEGSDKSKTLRSKEGNGNARKEEPGRRKDVAGHFKCDAQENNLRGESNVGGPQEKRNEKKENERKDEYEGKALLKRKHGSQEPPGVGGDGAETKDTPQRENAGGEINPEEEKSGKIRATNNTDAVNPKKPKPMPDTDKANKDLKERHQTGKKSKSKGVSGKVSTFKAVDKKDSKKGIDGKSSFVSMKNSVNKMLVKLTPSRTLVAEGLTAAIRQKHKKQEQKGNETCNKKSVTKTVHIPVVFEEIEFAFQSKSSVKINLEHSTDEGNLSLKLVGIRNEETQDFGGSIQFCQSYTKPNKKCEDVETMKELLTSCVKKVENVLNNLNLEQNEAMKNKHSPKIKNPTIGVVEIPPKKSPSILSSNSGKSLGSNTSIRGWDRRISFRANLTEVVPLIETDMKPEDETEDVCSGGPDGKCKECEEDENLEVNKDVNEIVEAKLNAGEFDREARKSFEREHFSLALKDTDAIERYKKNSQSKVNQEEETSEGPAKVEDNSQNSSKTNLAVSLSADDKAMTTILGISTWPGKQLESDQSVTSDSNTKGAATKDDASTLLPNADMNSTPKSSTDDNNTTIVMAASIPGPKISANFENVAIKSTRKHSTISFGEQSVEMKTPNNINYDNTPLDIMIASSSNHSLSEADKNSTTKSLIFDNKNPVVMTASASSRPIDAEQPEGEAKQPKKKGCCELL